MNNNFDLIVTGNPGVINLNNFDELKVNLSNYLMKYKKNYETEAIEVARRDKRELRTLRKKITDKRRELKEEFFASYELFEEKLNELLKMIDEPLKQIESYIKHEDLIDKTMMLDAYINERGKVLGEHLDKVKMSPAFSNEKWKNSSYSLYKAKKDVDEIIDKAASEIQAIKLSQNENMNALMAHYYETLSLDRCFEFLDSMKNSVVDKDVNVASKEEYKIVKIKGTSTQIDMVINHMKNMNIEYEILEEMK